MDTSFCSITRFIAVKSYQFQLVNMLKSFFSRHSIHSWITGIIDLVGIRSHNCRVCCLCSNCRCCRCNSCRKKGKSQSGGVWVRRRRWLGFRSLRINSLTINWYWNWPEFLSGQGQCNRIHRVNTTIEFSNIFVLLLTDTNRVSSSK